jgi:hypothetical protein
MTKLEYPAFVQWVTDHMPAKLEVINTGQDLAWLKGNPEMLFPKTPEAAGKWFKGVQHRAQAQYFVARKLGVLLLGRRHKDGNFCGKNGEYESDGIVRYSPVRDWTHEQILAFVRHFNIDLPPTYFWPRGFRVGTGSWPARQWTQSDDHGWAEVFTIDPAIVEEAATVIPGAADWLARGKPKFPCAA